MANKLSIELEAKNADVTAAKVDKVTASVDQLNKKLSGISVGRGDLNPRLQRMIDEALGVSGARPPIIAPPIIGGAAGGRGIPRGPAGVALGLAAGLFSPFAGARILNDVIGHLGGGSGGGGGIVGSIFGGGGPNGWARLFVGLQFATRALRAAFEQLSETVRRGSQLYTQSGLAGRSPSRLFALQAAGSAIGLSPDAVTQLAIQHNLLRQGRGLNVGGEMIRAAQGLGDSKTATQILQNQGAFKQVYMQLIEFGDSVDQGSRSLFEFRSIMIIFGEALRGGLIVALGDVTRVINIFATSLTYVVQLIPIFIRGLESLIGSVFGGALGSLLPKIIQALPNVLPDQNNLRLLASGGVSRPESGWEKMGLIIQGGIGGLDYAKQTAENTKKIADALTGKASGVGSALGEAFKIGFGFHLP